MSSYPKPTNATNSDYPNALGAAIDGLNRRLKGNLLDNGAFQIWQHGTSIAAAGSTVWGPDRWALWRAGFVTGATVTRQTGGNGRYCARVQRDSGNASTAAIQFAQSLETSSSVPARSRSLTLAFRARCGANFSAGGSSINVSVVSGTGTDQSFPAAGFTGQATVASSNPTLTTSFQDFTLAVPALASSVNQLLVYFAFTPSGTAGTNDYIEIEEVQLVRGDYAGEFPYRSDADELAACQRFFAKSFAYGTAPAQNAGAGTGEAIFIAGKAGAAAEASNRILLPARMRGTPTVTLYNPAASNAQVRDETAAADCSAAASANVTDSGFHVTATGNASTAVGNILGVHWSTTAEI